MTDYKFEEPETEEVEVDQETLAAIDAGVKAADEQLTVSLDEARKIIIKAMRMIMIGGHTRNIGKTSVIESIIRGLSNFQWTAVKITQFGHGVCSINGESCGCSVNEHEYAITEEKSLDSGTDTARFLAAGARRSLWVRTKQGEVFTALPSLKEEIANDDFVIIESNSLRRFIKPDLYIQVLDESNQDFKSSAQEFFDLSDAFVLTSNDESLGGGRNAAGIDLLSREIQKNKPVFTATAADRFISWDLIDFVESRLN
jgi:molybdopterin-guanine dinucleotide biosynthesis protein